MNTRMVECPSCGEDKEHIGKHWRWCERPDLSKRQKEIVTGMVLGDGSIATTGHNDFFRAQMVNQPFLHWLDNKLGIFSLGVELHEKAEDAADRCEEQGLFETINRENYHDSYYVQSRRHPWFNTVRDRFYTNGKQVPEDLWLTPLITKMWYISDGSLNFTDTATATCRIGIRSQTQHSERIVSLFEDIGFSPTVNGRNLVFPKSETYALLGWMGDPPDGFEYKWEWRDKDEYKTLMSNQYEV